MLWMSHSVNMSSASDHNVHPKLACAPSNQYKAILCTTKVYVIDTELHDLYVRCEPPKYMRLVHLGTVGSDEKMLTIVTVDYKQTLNFLLTRLF